MASEIQKLRARAANTRARANEVEQDFVRKAVTSMAGAGFGLAERKGVRNEIAGVPVKLGVALAATVGQVMSRGSTRRFFSAVADTAIAVYAYNSVRTGAFVAGIEEVAGDDDDSGGRI